MTPRAGKPRASGLTHVLDRGLSLRALEELLDNASPHLDLLKFGWGTCCVTPQLGRKVELAQSHAVRVGAGGTLLEVAALRGRQSELLSWFSSVELDVVEVSDGLGRLGARKRELIRGAAGRFLVIAEVGLKSPARPLTTGEWVAEAAADLEAGADYILIEGRESGTVGAFNSDGSVRKDVVDALCEAVPSAKLIFEAPRESQQAWFVSHLGPEINLGNVAPNSVIPLETLRLGLRADTAFLGTGDAPAATGSGPTSRRPATATHPPDSQMHRRTRGGPLRGEPGDPPDESQARLSSFGK